MGLLDFIGKAVSSALRPSFKDAVDRAPNQIGVYLMWHEGRVKYVGRAIENRDGQSTRGLRKRLQEHYRGAANCKSECHNNRDEIQVTWYTYETEEEARENEAKLIRKYDTVDNGWNLRYED